MEKQLRSLFEYQAFAGNPRLEKMLEEAEQRYGCALADDDLSLVNAAGAGSFTVPPASPIDK